MNVRTLYNIYSNKIFRRIDMPVPTITFVEMNLVDKARFEMRTEKKGENECWNWTGAINKSGYGNFQAQGKTLVTSRAAWMIHNGPIPEGDYVCHTCDNPKCVNPAHLFIGTAKDNLQDMTDKGRRARVGSKGSKNHKAIISEEDVPVIRKRFAEGESAMKLAMEYGFSSPQRIREIVNRQRWAHVE